MGVWGDLLRFLFPRRRWYFNHGGRLINPYQLPAAGDEEKLLMLSGVARSPDDAHQLLNKHNTSSAKTLLENVPQYRKRVTFLERVGVLFRRIDGHDPRDPWGGPKYDQPVVKVQYRYRNRY